MKKHKRQLRHSNWCAVNILGDIWTFVYANSVGENIVLKHIYKLFNSVMIIQLV